MADGLRSRQPKLTNNLTLKSLIVEKCFNGARRRKTGD